eukprot:3783088-Alexandrium_andersonii.AAC.1
MPRVSCTATGCASHSIKADATACGRTTSPPSSLTRKPCPNVPWMRRACLAAAGKLIGAGA